MNSSSNNIKVLIIIGSILQKNDENNIPTNYSDYSSGLLIYKIFTEMFGLTSDDIIITCAIEDYFTVQYYGDPQFFGNKLLTKTFNYYKGAQMYLYRECFFSFKKSNRLFLSTANPSCYADIRNTEYSFQIDPSFITKTIKPFHFSALNGFKTDAETELIVFIIDHGDDISFSSFNIDTYISEINKIPSKHNHVFIDSFSNGSLIQMIQLSQYIASLIKQPDGSYNFDPEKLCSILYILEEFYKIEKPYINQKEPSESFVNLYKEWFPNKDEVDELFKNVDISSLRKNVGLLNSFQDKNNGDRFNYLNPEQTFLFSQKSEVFCSSIGDFPSFFMPLRSNPEHSIAYYPGIIFLSSCIEALVLSDHNLITNNTIITSIRNSMIHSKELFYDLLKLNYEDVDNNIDKFFASFSQDSWFYLNSFDFPNINAMKQKEITEIAKTRKVELNEYLKPATKLRCFIIPKNLSDSEDYWAKTIDEFNEEFPRVVSKILKENGFKPFSFLDYPIEPGNSYPGTLRYYYKIKNKIKGRIDSVYLNYLSESGSPFCSYIDQFTEDEVKKRIAKLFTQAFFKLDEEWKQEHFSKQNKHSYLKCRI